MQNSFNITEQEKIFMKYLAQGTMIKGAAKKLKVSVQRAYTISGNIRHKLNAKNMANAIYIALNNKIID